ncbi:YjfB family protein [Clostridium butyricum]|uniref:YjfB family protein n=1 Tax=Clostridium butyricum TaxID=1492 RepID=UPI00374F7757
MDIAALSMNLSQTKLQNSVQLSLMKMTIENSTVMNEQMTDMIENMAYDYNLGTKLDCLV